MVAKAVAKAKWKAVGTHTLGLFLPCSCSCSCPALLLLLPSRSCLALCASLRFLPTPQAGARMDNGTSDRQEHPSSAQPKIQLQAPSRPHNTIHPHPRGHQPFALPSTVDTLMTYLARTHFEHADETKPRVHQPATAWKQTVPWPLRTASHMAGHPLLWLTAIPLSLAWRRAWALASSSS